MPTTKKTKALVTSEGHGQPWASEPLRVKQRKALETAQA